MKEKNLKTFYGILMSILLGLLGCLAWLLVSYFKIVAGYVSLLIFILTYVGYKRVSGKTIFKFYDYLIVLFIALIETALTFLLSYSTRTIELTRVTGADSPNYNIVTAIGQYGNVANINANFKTLIILDGSLALTGIFVGLIIALIVEYNKIKQEKIKEIQAQRGYNINFEDFGIENKKHKKQKVQKPIDVTKDLKLKTKKVKKVKQQTNLSNNNVIVTHEDKYDKIKDLLDKNKQ